MNTMTKETILEEAAIKVLHEKYPHHPPQDSGYWKDMFIEGAKWQQEQDSWKFVSEQTPPTHTELLVKSPEDVSYIASWRVAYSIFTCQSKGESSFDWRWKTI